jgi:hypothetical protein
MSKCELKPCPFCGGKAELRQDIRYPRPDCEPRKAYEVVCTNYECIIGLVDDRYRLTEQEIINLWNARADI